MASSRSLVLVPSFLAALVLSGCDIATGKCNKGDGSLFGGPLVVDYDCNDPDTGIVDSGETGDSDSVPDTDTDSGDSDSSPDTDSAETGETGETGDSDTDTAVPTDADGDGFNADDDCDDTNAAIHPGATEICDGVDNDCDGTTDVGAADESTFYADTDGDGYGDATVTVNDCSAPAGYVSDSADCDDTNAAIHPYVDEDCSATEDLNCDGSFGYADADADSIPACEDCDDTDASAYPGNTETCDGVDNDCEGGIDEDATDEITWYADSDGDSYGDPDSTTSACDEPSGYVADSTDCNDAAATAHPGGTEVCDSSDVDENCDGIAEASDSSGATIWHEDGDGDGYGSEVSVTQCDAPSGYITTADIDCDDEDSWVNPGATEACNGIDDDCDDEVDESGATGETTWYSDADLDGYGDPSISQLACAQPSKYVADATDCDDTSNSTYPGAPETCDGTDEDCDGSADNDAVDALIWYADTDADGYGDGSVTAEDCSAPAGYVADSTDCDDGDSGANPGEAEVCDSVDNDCDGSADEGLGTTYYLDADADGYGDGSETASGCAGVPAGYVVDDTDCDDGDAGVNPGETEVCNGVDDDCDGGTDEGLGSTTYYRDSDGDTYGDSSVSTTACSAPSGYVANGTDCDDGDVGVNPGETEIEANGVDDDCSGTELVFYTDFGISTGACTLDGYYTSSGAPVRQAGGCYLWIEGNGSLTAPSVSLDIDISGLTPGETYYFDWRVNNASTSSKTFVGSIDGASIVSLSVGSYDYGTLEDVVTVGAATVTPSVWHTGTNMYDGVLVELSVER